MFVRRFFRIGLMALIGLCCGPMVQANLLDVRLEAGRSNFLLDEPIVVNVVIRNNTDSGRCWHG